MKNKNTKYYLIGLIAFVAVMLWFGGSTNRANTQFGTHSGAVTAEQAEVSTTQATPEIEIIGGGNLEIEILE